MRRTTTSLVAIVLFTTVALMTAKTTWAQQGAAQPSVSFNLTLPEGGKGELSPLHIVFLLTLISVAPSLLIMLTCFTRIIIVLSLLRMSMGTPQTPPNQVLVGLALFLTFFVMAPTLNQVNQQAVQPYLAGKIHSEEAIQRGIQPLRNFMLRQTRENDLALFIHLGGLARPSMASDAPTYAVIPAFILSEVRTGFEIGSIIAIPFLIIDFVVASTIMSMGMLMLPPVLISLPFKILLFVMVNGWHLLLRGLASSIR